MARVLIAEDEPTTRKIVGLMVEQMGHIPIYSPDGQHALESLQTDDTIDLLITDIMMPRMDGKALILTVREDEQIRRLPVIVMSAVVSSKEIYGLLELGAARFLPKPLSMEVLHETVEVSLAIAKAEKERMS